MLREKMIEAISLWTLNDSEWPSDLADDILAIPELVEALEALAREESYSSIYDDPGP